MLTVSNLSIRFGGIVALDNVSFSVNAGEILALIGPNGAGKTTLFNCVSGVYVPTSGKVELAGRDISTCKPHQRAKLGMTRTFQNLQVFENLTLLENVMVGRCIHERSTLISSLLGLPSVRRQNRETRVKALKLLETVGIGERADQKAGSQSYGILKRLEIARALATDPKVLMLDEPVAGCNSAETTEVVAVIRRVADLGVCVVLVEHDMHMVMELADRVHVLAQGCSLAEGVPEVVRNNPAVIEVYLGAPEKEEPDHA